MSSTPAVVRGSVGVGGAVWVDKHRVIHYSHTAPKLSSPDGYRLGITPSQYCIKPTQQNKIVLALQMLPTAFTKPLPLGPSPASDFLLLFVRVRYSALRRLHPIEAPFRHFSIQHIRDRCKPTWSACRPRIPSPLYSNCND